MKGLFLSGRELSYPRNRLVYEFLAAEHDMRYIGRKSGRASILWESFKGTFTGLAALTFQRYSFCYLGFFSQFLMCSLGMAKKSRFLMDAFVSAYDTLCFDRQKYSPGSLAGRLAFALDRSSCKRADRILVDTKAHAEYFVKEFGVDRDKIDVLFVGCDDQIFKPIENWTPGPEKTVLFYGSFLPLHGLDVILEAAAMLWKVDRSITFRLIGPQLQVKKLLDKSQDQALENIAWRDPVPIEQLPAEIQRATICLGGHFGSSNKAKRTIAGKTFQCLAMGKTTIVGDNDANRELLEHGVDAWFCKMNDATALADAILLLFNDPELCQTIGSNARKKYLAKASNPVLHQDLQRIIQHLMAGS